MLAALVSAVGPLAQPFSGVDNPIAFAGSEEALDGLSEVQYVPGLLLVLPAGTSLVLRLRRSLGVERAQLKWFVYAVVLMFAAFAARSALPEGEPPVALAVDGLEAFLAAMLPVSAGVAILRHRLYDIDVVINRTLVYGALTATLAGVYLGRSVPMTDLPIDVILRSRSG